MNRSGTRVFVITAFGGPSIRHLSIRKGAILYLEKPVDPDLLAEVLLSPKEEATFSGKHRQHNILLPPAHDPDW